MIQQVLLWFVLARAVNEEAEVVCFSFVWLSAQFFI